MNTNYDDAIKTNVSDIGGSIIGGVGKLVLYMGAGLSGLIIVPTLSILSFVFGVVGVAVFVIPFVNLLGFASIPYFVLGALVTGLPQVLVGMVTGTALLGVGVISGYGLKKYFDCVKWVLG